MNDYYVYAYLRKKDSENGAAGTPYYIGKGRKARAYSKVGRKIVPSEPERIKIVHSGLTEQEAFLKEKELVAIYGRIDTGTGCLRNHTDGGEGVAGGHWKRKPWTKEAREAFRIKMRPIWDSFVGHPHTDEAKAKIGKAHSGKQISAEMRRRISLAKTGRPNPHKGYVHSEETKRKLSEALAGRKHSEEWVNKMIKSATGKKRSDEARQRISDSKKGTVASDETKRKLSIIRTGIVFSDERKKNISLGKIAGYAKRMKQRLENAS